MRWSGVLAIGVVVSALAACSSGPVEREEPEPAELPERPPADFTLSITVRGPAATPEQIDATARAQRPGRYIVEPDGVLRAAIGPGATPRVFPRETRQLDDAQIERLWRLVANTGLLEPGTLTKIESTETFFPSRERATALVYIHQGGTTGHYAVRLPVGDAESPAVAQLIEEVAALAWVPE